jgi:RimJ/RimL family protein N-acetyltransferase
MNYATIKDFDEVWKIFQDNKEWFPHVRSFHIKNRLNWGQIILDDGVLITQQMYQQTRKIGQDTNVKVQAGSYLIHQIINSDKSNGKAKTVIRRYFDHVETDVYLTVRKENIVANRFYKKVGMKDIGTINWSKGAMKGIVWLIVKS